MLTEPLAVTLTVIDVLAALDVPYAIGGSLSSAFHGVMRATMDADLVVDLRVEHTTSLVNALKDAFYIDEAMVRDAIQRRGSFNIVHLETMFKIDIFVAGSRPLDRAQLERRQLQRISDEPAYYAYFTTAEDIILAKLQWYRLGNEISDRQWCDVLGVFKVQGDALDIDYIRCMAAKLGLVDLVKRVLQQAS